MHCRNDKIFVGQTKYLSPPPKLSAIITIFSYSTQVASSSDSMEGAILRQTVLKGIANQLSQATVS